jgi:hypothetical protein
MVTTNPFFDFVRNVIEDIKIELAAQGHELTGGTANSMTYQVRLENGTVVLEAEGSKVIAILDKGVGANRIPYSGGSGGKGGTSAYIQGLKQFAMLRFGVDEKKALGIAFAIAKKHKIEGMPTKASYQYSETGERLSAVEIVFKENDKKYDDELGARVDDVLFNAFPELNKTETV